VTDEFEPRFDHAGNPLEEQQAGPAPAAEQQAIVPVGDVKDAFRLDYETQLKKLHEELYKLPAEGLVVIAWSDGKTPHVLALNPDQDVDVVRAVGLATVLQTDVAHRALQGQRRPMPSLKELFASLGLEGPKSE